MARVYYSAERLMNLSSFRVPLPPHKESPQLTLISIDKSQIRTMWVAMWNYGNGCFEKHFPNCSTLYTLVCILISQKGSFSLFNSSLCCPLPLDLNGHDRERNI